MRVDIVMPVEEGRYIPQEVLEGIIEQETPFRLWISTRFSDGQYADARNQVKQYGESELVLMLDNDIVMPSKGLEQMIEFLHTHPDYGAIGLWKHSNLGQIDETFLHATHVDMSCVLFRKEILDKIVFVDHNNAEKVGRKDLAGQCECANCCYDIRQMGLEIGFLPGVYAQHIHNPKAYKRLQYNIVVNNNI